MDDVDGALIRELISIPRSTCITIYQPTHRRFPDVRGNSILFKNLLQAANTHVPIESRALLSPLYDYVDDYDFWQHQHEGAAFFSSQSYFRYLSLPYEVGPSITVGEAFYTKPLLKYLHLNRKFDLLVISQDQVTIYRGDRFSLQPLNPVPELPRNLVATLGEEVSEPHLTAASYNGTPDRPIRHGHGGRKPEAEKDLVRYFRAVDRTVWQHYSKKSGNPLILAALSEQHALFRRISINPQLMDAAIPLQSVALDTELLHRLAWDLMDPEIEEELQAIVDAYCLTAMQGGTAKEYDQVARAALAGRVQTLLLEEDQVCPGNIEVLKQRSTSESLGINAKNSTEVKILQDTLAEAVLLHGGEVYLLPESRMPVDGGVAAIFRY